MDFVSVFREKGNLNGDRDRMVKNDVLNNVIDKNVGKEEMFEIIGLDKKNNGYFFVVLVDNNGLEVSGEGNMCVLATGVVRV